MEEWLHMSLLLEVHRQLGTPIPRLKQHTRHTSRPWSAGIAHRQRSLHGNLAMSHAVMGAILRSLPTGQKLPVLTSSLSIRTTWSPLVLVSFNSIDKQGRD